MAVRMTEPYRHAAMWIDPGRMGGQPCLFGTRIPVESVAHYVAADSVAAFLTDFDCAGRRRDVLACCAWWTLNARYGTRFASQLRSRWKRWADDAWDSLWTGDGTRTPDPPRSQP